MNLSGLNVEVSEVARCFEYENIRYLIRLSKQPRLPLAVKLGVDKNSANLISYSDDSSIDVSIMDRPKTRGHYYLKRLYLESKFPFGLVVAWTWLKLDAECLVYPTQVYGPYDGDASNIDSAQRSLALSNTDLNNLREYQHSDSTSRIFWKKYASRDELIVRDSELSGIDSTWVDWDHYSGPVEERLKYLCYEVCALSDSNSTFGFKIPGCLISPSAGSLHRRHCLDALALFGQAR